MTIRDIHSRLRTHRLRKAAVAALMVGALGVSTLPSAHSTFAARSSAKGQINIGTKSFGEEYVVSEMYRLLLEKHGYSVGYHDLGETPQLQAAMLHGDIDLYPEYTGTGLQVVGIQRIITDPIKTYNTVKTLYAKKFNFKWLQQSPMNDTNGVGVTQATASKYHLKTLSDLAKVSGQLTFAGLVECSNRPDCYAGMQAHYNIHFKQFVGVEAAPLRYKGLASGQYDAVEVFTTDGPIRANHLVVLADNKHAVFPADHLAPVVRGSVLRAHPDIAMILNSASKYITSQAMKKLNVQVVLNSVDPTQAARAFLQSKHLI